jgi:hypothetical protein
MASAGMSAELLVDRFLPEFDVTTIHHTVVEATPQETYDAIKRTDLSKDPVSMFLGKVRDLPNIIERTFRGTSEPASSGPLTFESFEHMGWVRLAEEPGLELCVGLVGRFWHRDYGFEHITAEEFVPFDRPGFAKVAVSLSVRPYGAKRTLLSYEARTATTDETARIRFRRYWTLVGPGASILMRGALKLIKAEAEKGVPAKAEARAPEGG